MIATITLNPALDIAAIAPEVLPTIKIRCEAPSVQAGGGGINVARVAQRFGGDASPIVLAGGATGERLLALLEAEGLAAIAIPIAGETRESFTVTDGTTHEQFRFVLPGPRVAAAEADAVIAALEQLAPFPTIVVFSGSHPAGLPASFGPDLCDLAKRRAAQLIVDGPAPVLHTTRGATLIKPNERELSTLAGRSLPTPSAIISAARDAIGAGIAQNVLVSMGEAGALLVSAERAVRYGVPQVELVSAVGAGDSMVGALAAALASGIDLEDAVARGAAAGSAALLTPGTDLCWPDDAQRLLGDVSRAMVEEVA